MSPTTCIPWAGGVPAAGGHPVWWDLTAGPAPDLNRRIDDPRWRGSFAATYPESGTGTAAETGMFRALYDSDESGSYLYLSWWVQVDPVLSVSADRVTVGFQTAGGTTVVIRMPAFDSVPGSPAEATTSPGATFYTASGSAGSPWTITAVADLPDWIPTYERSWVDPTTNSWAVNLRVPMFTSGSPPGAWDDTGIDLGTTFRMWFEAKVTTPSGTGAFFHIWPRGLAQSGISTVPDPGTWAEVRIGGGPEDASCAAGIWLDVSHVGTTNTDGSGNPAPNLIKWSRTSPVANTFFAQPLNQTGGSVEGSDLHARFRLANWGSNPDWNDVPDPSVLWTDILPGLNDVVGSAGSVANGAFVDMHADWTMTTSTSPSIDDFDPPGPTKRRSHQCMLVELSGGGFDFGRSSVYRNMDVVQASDFAREAEISVKGLGALGSATHRTVYLYVQALNMPYTVEQKPPPPPPPPPPPEGGPGVAGVAMRASIPRSFAAARTAEPPTAWQVAQQLPTHMVHVFHETGETYEDDDGTQRPVLRAQTSFGVYVEHAGDLFGWDHGLEGDLDEIAPNFYRVRVPNNGVVQVTTKVTAHEQPRKRKPWWLLLLEWLIKLIRRLLGK